MSVPTPFEALWREHRVLLDAYGHAQVRCSERMKVQQAQIDALTGGIIRLRADVIRLQTALAWARDGAAPRAGDSRSSHLRAGSSTARLPADLVSRLTEADLVICQTGCLSHGAYWRVRSHCRRHGTPCLLVDHPSAVRILRIGDSGTDLSLAPR